MALNYRQNLFVFEYLVDYNATQAAIRAGYSERSAGSMGHDLLKLPEILEAISEAAQGRLDRAKVDADYVLTRLLEVDSMDVSDILADDGTILPVKQWPKVWRTNISAIDVSEILSGGDVAAILKKVKWPDKTKNRELLGKHINVGAFREKMDLVSSDGSMSPKEPTLTTEQALDLLRKNDLAP